MVWFTPIAATEKLEPLMMRFGEYAPPPRSVPTIDSLKTKAIFHAACHGMGCRTGYQLEQLFSFSDSPNTTLTEWSLSRNKIFDRWGLGKSPISNRPGQKKPSHQAEVRLDWLAPKTPLPNDIRRMALWRNLDPLPLATNELDQTRCLPGYYRDAHRGLWGMQSRTISGDLIRGARSMLEGRQRWHFIDILWQVMRASYDWLDSTPYCLAHLVWLDARQFLESDPAFGPICEPLYAIAARHFSCVQLSDAGVFESVYRRLQGAAIKPIVDRERLTIEVPSREILRCYDELSRTWNPEDNCA